MTKINDTLAAIILAARDSVVALAEKHARTAVRLVDALVRGQATADEIAAAERAARAAQVGCEDGARAAACACAEELLRAARFATEGTHARLVAAACMDAAGNCARALERGAAVR